MHRLKILAVSYNFPPMACPRSIQVSRLLDNLDAHVTVLCGEDPGEWQDPTIAPGLDGVLERVIRERFRRPRLLLYMNALADRYRCSWNQPDVWRGWVGRTTKRFRQWQGRSGYRPDLVLTFGMPMSDHLFGLDFKRRMGTPWIAHFSDPWADNPFRRDNRLTAWLNGRMERQVIEEADAVIFTSPETVELVMRKYPASWRRKAFYVPHCYDRSLFEPGIAPPEGRYVLRYLGSFYGERSPAPLLEALESMVSRYPALLQGVSIEFIGSMGTYSNILEHYPAAGQVVRIVAPVDYAQSLRLMQTAHCLLVIDAPSELSVFFPSKLVDYIAADRFILALSPPGATARVVMEVGGVVAHPADTNDIIGSLGRILDQKPKTLPLPTHRYEKGVVQKELMAIIGRVMGRSGEANT